MKLANVLQTDASLVHILIYWYNVRLFYLYIYLISFHLPVKTRGCVSHTNTEFKILCDSLPSFLIHRPLATLHCWKSHALICCRQPTFPCTSIQSGSQISTTKQNTFKLLHNKSTAVQADLKFSYFLWTPNSPWIVYYLLTPFAKASDLVQRYFFQPCYPSDTGIQTSTLTTFINILQHGVNITEIKFWKTLRLCKNDT